MFTPKDAMLNTQTFNSMQSQMIASGHYKTLETKPQQPPVDTTDKTLILSQTVSGEELIPKPGSSSRDNTARDTTARDTTARDTT